MMNLCEQPADILHNIALELPLERMCISKDLKKNIYNHDRFWQRRYRQDYGVDRTFEDCPQLGWRERYRIRKRMYRIWHNYDYDNFDHPRARRLIINNGDVRVLNTDGSVSTYPTPFPNNKRNMLTHDNIDAADIATGFVSHDRYILMADGTVLHEYLCLTPPEDPGWPKAKQIVPSRDADTLLITLDNRVYKTNTSGISKGLNVGGYTDITAKYMSVGEGISAYIDTENSVWFTRDSHHNGKRFEEWRWIPFFGKRGKSVTCYDGALILIDDDDDLWVFGDNTDGRLGIGDAAETQEPTKIQGVKGLEVHMGERSTMIVDIHRNLWVCGRNRANCIGLGLNVKGSRHPVKWPSYKVMSAAVSDRYGYVIGCRV